MILYCDTSALVKCYFREKHSELMIKQRREAEAVAISVVGYAEFHSAINRKKREKGLAAADYRGVMRTFESDWAGYVKIEITPELNRITGRLLKEYPLRAFDAIHLASMMLLRRRLADRQISFAGFDDRQRSAARGEKLPLIPSEDEM